MAIELKVPALPESVADATIAAWHKKVGDTVKSGENIVDLETDKVVLEVPALKDGVVTKILFDTGVTVKSGDLLAIIDTSEQPPQVTPTAAEAKPVSPVKSDAAVEQVATSPGVRRLLAEHDLAPTAISGSGKDGRVTK